MSETIAVTITVLDDETMTVTGASTYEVFLNREASKMVTLKQVSIAACYAAMPAIWGGDK